MKAIEKDRTRRYDSPLDLAADLRRYLQSEPVLAAAPSTTECTRLDDRKLHSHAAPYRGSSN